MATHTVLVVDDDKLTRFSLSKILGRAGYRTREAASAAEGMAAIADERPGVVFLDIRLPDRDGFAVLRAIQANYPQLPVVIMTAHHTEKIAREAKTLGAWAYLAKPCDPVELQSLASAALKSDPPPASPSE
jgi:DNA-binding NtrC family response regulator